MGRLKSYLTKANVRVTRSHVDNFKGRAEHRSSPPTTPTAKPMGHRASRGQPVLILSPICFGPKGPGKNYIGQSMVGSQIRQAFLAKVLCQRSSHPMAQTAARNSTGEPAPNTLPRQGRDSFSQVSRRLLIPPWPAGEARLPVQKLGVASLG